MVSPQATQPSNSPHPRQGDDSVRITAQDIPADVRRQLFREHYEHRALKQKAVTIEARNNRDSLTIRHRTNPEAVRPYQIDEANRQLTAARTVEQDVCANLAVYTDNREFRTVTR